MMAAAERDSQGVLDAPPIAVSSAVAQTVLETRFGLSGSATALGGERDRNFRVTTTAGHDCLLKFTHPAERETVTDFQVSALLRLAERDPTLPIPRVVHARDGDPAPVHILADGRSSRVRLSSYLTGTPLAGRVPSRPFCHRLGQWLARLDEALADFDHPVAGQIMPWDLQRAEQWLPQTESLEDPRAREAVRRPLRHFAEQLRPRLDRLPRQPIHNDLNGHNVLFAENDVDRPAGIIDFGDMLFAPRIVDLAVAAAYRMNDPADPLAGALALIGGYHRQSPLEPEERELLPGLIQTRLAMAITISTHRARAEPTNADYLLRNTATSWHALRHCLALSPGAFESRMNEALAAPNEGFA